MLERERASMRGGEGEVKGSGSLVATPAAPLKRRVGATPGPNWQHKENLGGQAQSRKHEEWAHGSVADGVSASNTLPLYQPPPPLKKGNPSGGLRASPPLTPSIRKTQVAAAARGAALQTYPWRTRSTRDASGQNSHRNRSIN